MPEKTPQLEAMADDTPEHPGQDIVIITGLSGAGKTTALRVFEDLGYFCIDNLPPALIGKFIELCLATGTEVKGVALVIDIRTRELFEGFSEAISELKAGGYDIKVLYLDAEDHLLVRRYKETRRLHPLAGASGSIIDGITEERLRLEPVYQLADFKLDTTNLSVSDLKTHIYGIIQRGKQVFPLDVRLVSFGYKWGIPLDADLVFDVRFLPNPFYEEDLKSLSGLDDRVTDYVMRNPASQELLNIVTEFVMFLIPHFVSEGKMILNVCIGCTGGKHRSVVMANELAQRLEGLKVKVSTVHRDADRT
jgi:UPF0042 nucleotide-binding protein